MKRILHLTPLLVLCLSSFAVFADETITLLSGMGGGTNFQTGVRRMGFGDLVAHAPSQSNFAEAQQSALASILDVNANGWTPLFSFPAACPVGITYHTGGGSSLFAVPFTLSDTSVCSASLYVEFRVDNYLGGDLPDAQGLYLNGQPLTGDTRFFDAAGRGIFFSGAIYRTDIATLLLPGSTNWLYFNVTDCMPGCVIMFGVTLSIATFPPPSTLTISPFVQVSCTTETNRQYQFQWASSLDTNTWFNLQAPITGDGFLKCIFDSAQVYPRRFYRVITLP